jgi:hypothetical protein
MKMSILPVDFDQDSWWGDFHTSNEISTSDSDDIATNFVSTSFDRLGRLHRDCACRFYDETISKQNFFEVCCLFWMEQFLHNRPKEPKHLPASDDVSSAKDLFKALKATYISLSQQYEMSMIRWIMPSPSAMSVISEQIVSMNGGKQEDEYYLSLLMNFWSQFFDGCNKEDNPAVLNDENQRPTKRRRFLSRYIDFSSSSHFNGKHNLSAAILLLLIMQKRCESWDHLVQNSKKLPEVFPTFSSNTIQSALALVGLHGVCQAIDIKGLSVGELFHSYFVADSR